MIFKKKNKEELIQTAQQFEVLAALRDSRSKKIAWGISAVCVVMTFCSVLAISALLPLKTVDIKVIGVDQHTGYAEEITTIKERTVTNQEALNRYFSTLYVTLREQYNYYSLQNDYDTVQLFNSPDVNKDYLTLFTSPNAPDVIYEGPKNSGNVEIISNSLTYGTDPDSMAMVRFKKTIRNIRTNQTTVKYFIARLTFHFELNRKMQEAERLANPLGFVVTSYEIDEELRQ